MPFFPVDDGFAFHRKTVRAGNAAVGLWTRAGSWCNWQLTDGFVPDDVVTVLGTASQAERLVKAGLWHRADGGYVFHEYLGPGRNKSRAEVELRRKNEAEKKARARAAKGSSGKEYERTGPEQFENSVEESQESNDLFSTNPQVSDGCPPGTPEGVPRGVPRGVLATPPLPYKQEKKTSSSSTSAQPTRDDVEQLCQRLHGRVTANGAKATITKKWRDEARRLIDLDGRELTKALNLIDWATSNTFWAPNILSMPKFRERYDQLQMQALREWGQRNGSRPAAPGAASSTGSKRVDKAMKFLDQGRALMAEREQQEALAGVTHLTALEGGMTA